MQKRFEAIFKALPAKPDPHASTTLGEKLQRLRQEAPGAAYIRQAGLVPGMLPISPATLWRWVKNGDFPPPIKLSARVTAWRIADVENWLTARQTR